MNLTKIVFLSSLLSLSLSCFSQKKGIVRFAIEVDNGYFEILLNDTLLVKSYKDTLPVGHYNGVVWSPSYEAKVIEFDVIPGDNSPFYLKLEHNEAHYNNELVSKNYDRKRRLYRHTPVYLSVGGLLTSGVVLPFLRKSSKDLEEQVLLYDYLKAPHLIRNYKADFIPLEKKYNLQRTLFYAGIGVSCASIVTAVFTFRYFNSHFRYSNLKEESPWHDRFSMNFGLNTFNLTLKI